MEKNGTNLLHFNDKFQTVAKNINFFGVFFHFHIYYVAKSN